MPRKKKPETKSAFAEKVLSLAKDEAEETTPAEHVASASPLASQTFTLEEAFTADWGAKISTATPCQRAICRLLEGRPLAELSEDPNVKAMFGGKLPRYDGKPEVAMILSGIRTAKSTTIALMAIWLSQTVELPEWIRGSDELRIPILSVDIETARPTFSHVRDTILGSPRLSALLARDEKGKPIEPKTDSLLLRHPSGKHIEIKVVAINRAGSSLTARWFVGAIFDECPRLGSETEFIRSFDESYRACLGRILPGGLIMLGGSPHARTGPVYEMFREHFGNPTKELTVVKAKAHWLNPQWWTPKRRAALKAKDPIAHQTDVECEFKDPESALGDSESIEGAMRKDHGHIAPVKGHHYVAAMDPATRVNSWTLTVVECSGYVGVTPKYQVAYHKQWTPDPGKTLSPSEVFREAAAELKRYRLSECYSDIHGTDFAVDLAAQYGLDLYIEPNPDKLELGRERMALIKRGLFGLPNDGQMREDLQSVRTRTSTNGNVTILLPKTSGGRHCDYFPALCLCVKNLPDPPDSPEEAEDLDREDLARELREFNERHENDGTEAARRVAGY